MKIVISENQLKKLVEANTPLDKINNFINLKDYVYNYGFGESNITPSSVIIEGELSDGDLTVRVTVDTVTYGGEDVSEFAKSYALYVGDYDQDTPLAFDYKEFVAKKINDKVLRMTPFTVTDYDIILELY